MRLEKMIQKESDIIKVEIKVLKTGLRSRSEVCIISKVRMLPRRGNLTLKVNKGKTGQQKFK